MNLIFILVYFIITNITIIIKTVINSTIIIGSFNFIITFMFIRANYAITIINYLYVEVFIIITINLITKQFDAIIINFILIYYFKINLMNDL